MPGGLRHEQAQHAEDLAVGAERDPDVGHQPELAHQADVLGVAATPLEHLGRNRRHHDRLSALEHAIGALPMFGAGRKPALELPGPRLLVGVNVRDRDAPQHATRLDEVHGAPIGDRRDSEPSDRA